MLGGNQHGRCGSDVLLLARLLGPLRVGLSAWVVVGDEGSQTRWALGDCGQLRLDFCEQTCGYCVGEKHLARFRYGGHDEL